jgi:asparagine synthase (glutamine-hydrolysing)
MCGIAGFTPGFSESVPADIAVQRMVAAIRHRGPDALTHTLIDGVALGHARLAIVDLEGGAQPMTDRDTGVTVVFNGEVFNHIELRERLRPHYAFRTRSDTEVILAAYSVGGIDSVAEFNGQFAFALYDPRSRDLFLVRDRFGERPIYYAIGRSGLGFASEAKALFAAGVVDAQLDSVSLWQTLHLWAPTDTRSMFRGIHAIPPATIARVSSDGELTMRRSRRTRRTARRRCPPSSASRRACRRVRVRGTRLEPAVRVGTAASQRPIAHVLGRILARDLRRTVLSGRGRRRPQDGA